MATHDAKKDVKKPREKSPADDKTVGKEARPRRHFFRRILILPLLLLLAVWAAPIVVAHTSLRNWILQAAVHPHGTIHCSSASFGWFSAPVLGGLEVRDSQDNTVVKVAALTGDKSLVALAINHRDVGQFTVDHPVVHLVTREDGSNVEDVFAPPVERREEAKAPLDLIVQLQVVDGVVSIEDVPGKRQFQLEGLALTLNLNGADAPLALEGSATLPTEARPASFKIALHAGHMEGGLPQSGDADCHLEALPLNLAEPVLRRVLPGARVDGLLSTNLRCKWGDGESGDSGSLDGEIAMSGLRLSADALGGDELRLERLNVPCQISRSAETVKIDRLEIDSDLAQLSASGSARLRELSAANLMSSLAHETYTVEGHADLARLAQMLPHTLHVREGTEITSGKLALNMTSGPAGDGATWSGRLEASDLAGTAEGRPLNWDKPLSIDFTIQDGLRGPVVERARCVSSFLSLEGSGTLDNLSATGQFDLGRLADELGQFVDLAAVRLGGQGSARMSWQRGADGGCVGHADFLAQQFQLVVPGRRPWQEAKLDVQLDVAGTLTDRSFKKLDSAQLQLSAPDERLSVQLAGSVDDVAAGQWPVEVSWQGPIAAWLPRLESWMNLNGWDVSGNADVQAAVNYSSQSAEISRSKIALDRLHVWGHDCFIDEPRVDVACAAKWDAGTGVFSSSETTIAAGQVQLRLKDANLETRAANSAGGIVARGGASYEADLAQIRRWFQDPRGKAVWSLGGKLSGTADVSTTGGVTTARVSSKVDDLEVAEQAAPAARGQAPSAGGAPREQKISLDVSGSYNGGSDLLTVERGQIVSDALRCEAAGQIAALTGRRDVDLKGKFDYDWDTLAPLWRRFASEGMKIAGKGSREFSVRGPCGNAGSPDAFSQLVAQGGIDWSSAELYGMPLSKGELTGKLAGGVVQFQPIDLDVSSGHVNLLAQRKLSPAPTELRLSKSALARDVQITPEVCAQGLKFIAPIVADATVAEGKFSIDLDGARLPTADPAGGGMAGRLAVQSVQVKAGGMADQLISLGKEIATASQGRAPGDATANTLLKMDNQTIDFVLVDRRIYHRGIRFLAGNVQITTFGSVGLDDESLAIMAEVPLPGSGANGGQAETLQIPIDGTLKNPKLDRRAIPQIAGKLLESKAKGAILDKVNQQLEKLLPVQR